VYVFPPCIRHADFTITMICVGELILCGQTIEVTVYVTAQLIFPLSL